MLQSLCILAISLALCCAPAIAQTGRIRVDATRPLHPVPSTLWGIFFEEINHAGDGGLYAELVRNRSFEDSGRPEAWSPVADGTSRVEMALETSPTAQLNQAQRQCLALRAQIAPGGGRAGVANTGYWGINVRKGKTYALSLFARTDAQGQALDVSLETSAGAVLARGSIRGIGGVWKRHALRLRAEGDDPAARLVICLRRSGTVWLDVVSLFPPTWKGRPNGLRPDLAEMLAALRPGFVRFPGGCYCEGNELKNAFRWKKSMGPIETRPGHLVDVWGYRSQDGLGFHEYLQMCEDLGAEPLFVINCGMAHRDVAPMDQMGEFVQDALDAIEYANGPVTSKWGALRAANGHPKPFGLKYMEIGNENSGPAYEERYALFYDAIRARFPEVRLVANVPVRSRPYDIVAEHYYSSPEWFVSQATRYDDYDRSRPKIQVGEYAVTAGAGKGNLAAALAEAAFMTGMERNSDHVVMASYAPLFVNVNDRTWNPDLICFDSSRVYGIPSYHVQKLFRDHRPDRILPLELDLPPVPAPIHRGSVGLGTWLTRAEYRDLRVEVGGQVVYEQSFASGAPDWRPVRGRWSVEAGAYRQTSDAEDVRSVLKSEGWTDCTLTVKARKISGAEGFLILFRVRDDLNWYWWNIGGWGNRMHGIEKAIGGGKSLVGEHVPGAVEAGRWYDIRIELSGPRIRCWLDGQLIHDARDVAPQPLAATAGLIERTGEIVLKVVNTSDSEQRLRLEIASPRKLEERARMWLLTSGSVFDENDFDAPLRVSPQEHTVRGVAHSFVHAFPAHSLAILRIRQR